MSNAATQTAPIRTELALNPDNPREREIMLVEREFAFMQRRANVLASSTIVPKEYQQNIPNCMIAMEMANRLGTGDLEIMQNLDVIHGRPSFRAKYLIARVNTSNILRGRLRFEFEEVGEKTVEYESTEWVSGNKQRKTGKEVIKDKRCRAIGIAADTGVELVGTWVSIEMAVKEGWYTKSGSKWKTMEDQMLQYRAASFWSSIHAPDATMGMATREELEDISAGERDITPQAAGPSSTVQDMLKPKAVKQEEKAESAVIDGEIVDKSTGEVITAPHGDGAQQEPEPEPATAPIKMADVQRSLETAANLDELQEAADLIRDVANPAHRTLLNGIYEKRAAELQQ